MAGYLSHICGYVRTLRHSQKEKPLPLATANDCSVKALLQTLSRVIAPWYFILYMKTSIRSVGSRDFYVDTPEMGSSFCCSLAVFKTSTAAFRSSSLPAISCGCNQICSRGTNGRNWIEEVDIPAYSPVSLWRW